MSENIEINNKNEWRIEDKKRKSNRKSYTNILREQIKRRGESHNCPEQSDNQPNEASKREEETKMWIFPSNETLIRSKTKSVNTDNVKDNKAGHVTNEDICALKRWFYETWKSQHVIPFDLLCFESFLIVYFDYTYDEVIKLKGRKEETLKRKYALFLTFIAEAVGSDIFLFDNLMPFMRMCKRNFQKQQNYNKIIQSLISEKSIFTAGYLISKEVYLELKTSGYANVVEVKAKTRAHTIITWLSQGKFVHIPEEYHQKIDVESNLDVIESVNQLERYRTGYGSFLYTDPNLSYVGLNGPTELGWFCALGLYVPTTDLIIYAPQIKNFDYQPHLATVIYYVNNQRIAFECSMLVDSRFYHANKNESGVMNIEVSPENLLINNELQQSTIDDNKQLMRDITLAAHKLTGSITVSNPAKIVLQVRRSLAKMGTFMAKMSAARERYLSESKYGIYKIAAVASKASGKTTLIELIKYNLHDNIYVEDSDDYGKFITYLVEKYGIGNIDDLNASLSEEQVVNDAYTFVTKLQDGELTSLPSYYNVVVSKLIEKEVEEYDLKNQSRLRLIQSFNKLTNSLFVKYRNHIRDLYYKLDSGKIVNQKIFEYGIYRYMDEHKQRILLELFHIFSCNYRRKPPNLTLRYEPNFDTKIAILDRSINKDLELKDTIADILLQTFYDQSSEYVTAIIGPQAFLNMFGLLPILDYKSSLLFRFDTYTDVSEPGVVQPYRSKSE